MSTGNEKRHRQRSTRARRASRTTSNHEPITVTSHESSAIAAREHYRREKARRAERVRPPEHPLEQARRAYHALLAADAERAKGGRPKKTLATQKRSPAAGEEPESDSGQ